MTGGMTPFRINTAGGLLTQTGSKVDIKVTDGIGSVVVKFPHPFGGIPAVVATPRSGGWIVTVSAESATGFTLWASPRSGSGSGSTNANWIAIGPPA